jgi:hypothetical protein
MVLIQTRNDDITGEPEAITCVITVNGEGIEIDLAEKSMQKLVKALEPFWQVGSPGKYDIQRRGVAAKRGATVKASGRTPAENREIRDWARANGIEVPVRGVLANTIIEQYEGRDK